MLKTRKKLIGKTVVSKEGDPLGKISESIINDETGEIDYIIIKPLDNIQIWENNVSKNDDYTIPSSCFISVKDIVVIEEYPKKHGVQRK